MEPHHSFGVDECALIMLDRSCSRSTLLLLSLQGVYIWFHIISLQFPKALHHHACSKVGRIPGHDWAGVPHPAACLQTQDEEPGVDQRHFCSGWRVSVCFWGWFLHRQGERMNVSLFSPLYSTTHICSFDLTSLQNHFLPCGPMKT